MGASDEGGFVRVVARKADNRIIGVQAVGAHISEAGAFHHSGAPYPGGGFHQASLKTLGRAIHIEPGGR